VYDVVPHLSVASERFQHFAIGTGGKFAALDNALSQHQAFQLSERFACELIAEVSQVVNTWQATFEEFDVSAGSVNVVRSAFRTSTTSQVPSCDARCD
jgi:serine/threonine-protein kinase HipA